MQILGKIAKKTGWGTNYCRVDQCGNVAVVHCYRCNRKLCDTHKYNSGHAFLVPVFVCLSCAAILDVNTKGEREGESNE
jgi:hypothetical protein